MDGHPPQEISRRVEQMGVAKARTDALTLFMLAILAGAFISIGACLYVATVSGSELGTGPTKLLGGVAFSVGLILVVVAGAELFTGNNLIAMAWASRRISLREVLRNWAIVYAGNVVGCLATVALVEASGIGEFPRVAFNRTAMQIAEAKADLAPLAAFSRGILCNALVCLAVWLAMGGRSVTDKILAVVFPIAAFVALGFEHSIANWFFLPYALVNAGPEPAWLGGMVSNLVVVTAGNIVGGTLLVAGVYWVAYLRPSRIGADGESS